MILFGTGPVAVPTVSLRSNDYLHFFKYRYRYSHLNHYRYNCDVYLCTKISKKFIVIAYSL